MDFAQRLDEVVQSNLKKRDKIEQVFGSVIVGRCVGVPDLCYKLIDLNLACMGRDNKYERITKIDSGDINSSYKFTIFAQTNSDFSKYVEVETNDLLIAIAPLKEFPGKIYSSEKKLLENTLIDYPRAIVVRDGRIYVERNFKDFDSWKKMPEVIKISSEFFLQDGIWSPIKNTVQN